MNFRLRCHPSVADDLTISAELIADHASPEIAKQKLNEINATARGLIDLPHCGTRRDHILPGLRAIPAARRAGPRSRWMTMRKRFTFLQLHTVVPTGSRGREANTDLALPS